MHIEKLLGHSVIDHFQWLCGTSTGAVIALGLAKGLLISCPSFLTFILAIKKFLLNLYKHPYFR